MMPIKSEKMPFVGVTSNRYIPFIGYKIHFVAKTKMAGFTLIELIVALAVAAIIVTVAIPNLRTLILNSRMTTQTNNLVSDISLARNEAIKRGARVKICTSSDGINCTTSGWNSGRLIFWEPSPFNQGPAPDRIIRYTEASGGSIVSGVPNSFPDPLIFDSRGAPIDLLGKSLAITTPMPILFTLCEVNAQVRGRQLSLNVTGQVITNPYSC